MNFIADVLTKFHNSIMRIQRDMARADRASARQKLHRARSEVEYLRAMLDAARCDIRWMERDHETLTARVIAELHDQHHD